MLVLVWRERTASSGFKAAEPSPADMALAERFLSLARGFLDLWLSCAMAVWKVTGGAGGGYCLASICRGMPDAWMWALGEGAEAAHSVVMDVNDVSVTLDVC